MPGESGGEPFLPGFFYNRGRFQIVGMLPIIKCSKGTSKNSFSLKKQFLEIPLTFSSFSQLIPALPVFKVDFQTEQEQILGRDGCQITIFPL
jgi:hypothetical protein